MNIQTIRQRVRELGPWFHNMDLAGIRTAPDHFLGNYPEDHWRTFEHALPADLTGRSVLDVGCNAGFFSLRLKERGAARVVGIDHDPRYLEQARLAAAVAGREIEFRQLTVYEVATLGERFDIVLFMGVLYHLRHPLLALDLLHQHAAADLLLFQSMIRGSGAAFEADDDYSFDEQNIFNRTEYPKLHFIEHKYAGDPTNWWVPNRACTEAMLRSSGFAVIDHPVPEVFLCRRETL